LHTPLCAAVARDYLTDTETHGPTATPCSSTASRNRVVSWLCVPQWLRPSSSSHRQRVQLVQPVVANFYNQLQCGEDSEYGRKTMTTSRCSTHCRRRTMNPQDRQARISNILLHNDVRAKKADESIGSAIKQGCCPQWSRDRSPQRRRSQRQRKTTRIEPNLMPH
jgi:hypothetical protein